MANRNHTPSGRTAATRSARRAEARTRAASFPPALRRRLSRDLGRIVAFVGGAPARTRQGELTSEVDFPAFVAGLIDGVFQAIVNASIQQMDAYADLVSSVARCVDGFRKGNVAADNARDYLSQKYAELLNDEDDSDGDDETSGGKRPPRRRKRLARAEQRTLVGAVTLLGMDRLLLRGAGRRTRGPRR